MITKSFIGKSSEGEDIYLYNLVSQYGSVKISSLGASVESIIVQDKNGNYVDVALGFDNVSAMEQQGQFIGSIVGRCANRIEKGSFNLNNKAYTLAVNDPPNHLHGGINGFNTRVWHADICDNQLIFKLYSHDGDEGYPGNLEVSVTYEFDDNGRLKISYYAVSDADTVVNLTNHTYFNLSGHKDGDITDHLIKINSDYFTSCDDNCLPNGGIVAVEGTPMDFRVLRTIGQYINCDYEQIKNAGGYDHNYIIKKGQGEFDFAGQAFSPKTGIYLNVYTDMPGLQFYSGNNIKELPLGKENSVYGKRSGFCLETQFYPNALRHKRFPSPILKAGEVYKHITCYQFGVSI